MAVPEPIRSTPLLEWAAGEAKAVTVEVTLPEGRTLADWGAFTLTVRADPLFPRQGADLAAYPDPGGDAWAVAVQAAGTPDAGAGTVAFQVTTPTAPGVRRYAVDVWGTGGSAGAAQIVPATWLTVTPSVR